MAEKKLNMPIINTEENQAIQAIKDGHNFLLSGGAGSGKTYSLICIVRELIDRFPTAKIACITYTNAAVRLINSRIEHPNVHASTIHDFLWDQIKNFQSELRSALVELINDPEVTRFKIADVDTIESDYFSSRNVEIQYKQYVNFKNGIISHDELLIIAEKMYSTHKKLCDLTKSSYQYIFVDEYQDTSKLVIDITLKHFIKSTKPCVLGFFGDAMQSIYDNSIGDLVEQVRAGKVVEITKVQNRRNPQKVIDLANAIRTDGLIQEPSSDFSAPNMQPDHTVKQGEIKFIYSDSLNLEQVRSMLGWDFSDSVSTKELNLTHNLIAHKAGFPTLMEIYDKDPVIGLKTEILKKIKRNISEGKPAVAFGDDDTFDQVVDKFALKNMQKKLKKDELLLDPEFAALYEKLKNEKFSAVRRIYLNKDSLIDDKKQDPNEEDKIGSKRDDLIKHLIKIARIITSYSAGEFNEFIALTDYSFNKLEQKSELRQVMDTAVSNSTLSIGETIEYFDSKKLCIFDDHLARFKRENRYIYERVSAVAFSEFLSLFSYLEGNTPFSTQHKTKGSEFKNVLVVMDNGNWNEYNFEYLFVGAKDKPSVVLRTQKIFYVCCTRAMENLAVAYNAPSLQIVEKAKAWFGPENVIKID